MDGVSKLADLRWSQDIAQGRLQVAEEIQGGQVATRKGLAQGH